MESLAVAKDAESSGGGFWGGIVGLTRVVTCLAILSKQLRTSVEPHSLPSYCRAEIAEHRAKVEAIDDRIYSGCQV